MFSIFVFLRWKIVAWKFCFFQMLELIQHQMGMWQLYFHLQPGLFVGGCGCCVPTFWFKLSWTKFGLQFLTVLSLVMEKAAALLKAVQCHDYRISGEIHAIQLCSDVWKTWTKQWLARYQNRLRRCHLPRWDARSTSFFLGNKIRCKSSIWRCVALSTQPKPQQLQLRFPESALFFLLEFWLYTTTTSLASDCCSAGRQVLVHCAAGQVKFVGGAFNTS